MEINEQKDGYKKNSIYNKKPSIHIKGNNITMDKVDKTLMAIKLDENGQPIGMKFMNPNENYEFDDSTSIVEIPTYQLGGLQNINFNPSQSGQFTGVPNFNTDFNSQFGDLPNVNSELANLSPEAYFKSKSEELRENKNQGVNPVTGGQELLTLSDTNNSSNITNSNSNVEDEFRKTQFFNPYGGVDIPTAATTLGGSIKRKDPLGIAASGVKLALGLGRNIVGGIGLANREQQVLEDFYKQRRELPVATFLEKGGTYMEGGPKTPSKNIRDLTNEELAELNRSTDDVFTQEYLNDNFGKDIPKSLEELPQPDLGRYADIDYFEILENDEKGFTLKPTRRNPHNSDSIKDIYNKIRKLNPGRELRFQEGGRVNEKNARDLYNPLISKLENIYGTDFLEESNSIHPYVKEGLNAAFDYTVDDLNNGNRKIPALDGDMKELQNYVLQAPDNEIKELLSKDYRDVNLFNVGKYLPENVSKIQAFKYMRKFKKLIDQGYTFKKGGKFEDKHLATGEYIRGINSDHSEYENANAEIESGEYLKTADGEVAEVVGKKHSQGGEKVKLDNNDRILTDYTKLGVENAKLLREKYDLKVKAKNTFSDVLDKYKTKSGLKKLIQEEESIIDKLDKLSKTKEGNDRSLNESFLNSKLNEIASKKEPLLEFRKSLYDDLYNLQEKDKASNPNDEFKYGGEKKLPNYQEGPGPKDDENFIASVNPNNLEEDFINQSETQPGFFGKATPSKLQNPEQDFPFILQEFYDIKRNENGEIISAELKEGKTVEGYQRAIDNNYQRTIDYIKQRYGDTDLAKSKIERVQKERFQEGHDIKGFDDLQGNFTISRPNFGFRAVTPEDLSKLKEKGINTYKELFGPEGNLKPDLDLSEKSKEYLKDFDGVDFNFLISDKDEDSPEVEQKRKELQNDNEKNPNLGPRTEALLLPDQYPLFPGAVSPQNKLTRRFDRVDAAQIDVEPYLRNIGNQVTAAKRQLEGLPPEQAAAVAANIDSNAQKNIAEVVNRIDAQNIQSLNNAENINAQIQSREENARVGDTLNFEQRQLTALAKTEEDIHNFFRQNQLVNVNNFNTVTRLNAANAINDNVQFRGDGSYDVREMPSFENYKEMLRLAKLRSINNSSANKSTFRKDRDVLG